MKTIFFISSIIFMFIGINICAQNDHNEKLTRVLIKTDSGSIILVLYEETILHKENFLKLTKEGYFDGQLFHRLIKDFMIQGGDPASKSAGTRQILGLGGPGYTIPAEINPKYYHKKGALAAARKDDSVNPTKSSSGSQFYIVQGSLFTKKQLDLMVERKMHVPFSKAEIQTYTKIGGAPHLDGDYTVFGEVIKGLNVLDKLMNVQVDANNRPLKDIKFTIKILE